MNPLQAPTNGRVGSALVVSLLIFAVDLMTPSGVAVGALYLVPVLVTMRAPKGWHTPTLAGLCTVLLLLWSGASRVEAPALAPDYARWLRKAAWIGALGFLLSVAVDWGITRAIHGDRFDGYGARHIRFGPESTATKEKPKAGQKHP